MGKLKKNITIIIAVLALILSGFSLYFQFFHKSNKLKALVVDFKCGDNDYNSQIAFVNEGNQIAVIRNIHLAFPHPSEKSFVYTSWSKEECGSTPTPIVVRPEEIVIKRIFWHCNHKKFIPTYSSYLWIGNKGAAWFNATIKFNIIDSSGDRHTVDHKPFKAFVIDNKVNMIQFGSIAINLLPSPVTLFFHLQPTSGWICSSGWINVPNSKLKPQK